MPALLSSLINVPREEPCAVLLTNGSTSCAPDTVGGEGISRLPLDLDASGQGMVLLTGNRTRPPGSG